LEAQGLHGRLAEGSRARARGKQRSPPAQCKRQLEGGVGEGSVEEKSELPCWGHLAPAVGGGWLAGWEVGSPSLWLGLGQGFMLDGRECCLVQNQMTGNIALVKSQD
jgi:hypothetical protein